MFAALAEALKDGSQERYTQLYRQKAEALVKQADEAAHLIGHTDAPAVNWLTARKARRMLRRAGFNRVYDRWDLRLPSEGAWAHAVGLRLIRVCPVGKFIADVFVSACSYAAVKDD